MPRFRLLARLLAGARLATMGDLMTKAEVGTAVATLLEVAARTDPDDVSALVDVVKDVVGAQTGRLFVADYGLRRLQELDARGPVGESLLIEGTLAGRAFATCEIVVSAGERTILWVPLADGTERLGLLELAFDSWDGTIPPILEPILRVFVLVFVSRQRYTDLGDRLRRAQPLSAAAEIQWDLLPPLACVTTEVSVAGVVEPAYEIGGDSFDYAFNEGHLDFAIVDAIGRGMSAVLLSAGAINSLRNVRREGGDLQTAYRQADRLITNHFGNLFYVTGQVGSLDLSSGILTWFNAGHVLPMLVRNGSYAGELSCAPSLPMGLGGGLVEIATERLQRGDRVLFYTDGITESRSPDGTAFGPDRLADFLARSTHDDVPVAETARRLAANVLDYVGVGLKDDATMFLIEWAPTSRD